MLSKQTQYTIVALAFLKDHNACADVKTIAEAKNIPAPFLAKLLQELARKKIISSKKGKHGGFYLTEKQKQRKLIEIVEFFEEKNKMDACALGFKKCSDHNPCPLHHVYKPAREALKKQFLHLSLKDL